jgi:undecaprenyl-diphosphatase
LHTPFWDVVFYWITGKTLWIPLYLYLFYLTYLKFGKKAFVLLLFFGLLIFIGDRASVELFKNVFERLRPSHNPMLNGLVHLVDGKGGQYGFVSSHATNCFALAIFSILLLRSKFKWILSVLLFWAVLVSYSRVYVGVHYPADLLGGAILGTAVAFFVFWLLTLVNQKWKLKINDL